MVRIKAPDCRKCGRGNRYKKRLHYRPMGDDGKQMFVRPGAGSAKRRVWILQRAKRPFNNRSDDDKVSIYLHWPRKDLERVRDEANRMGYSGKAGFNPFLYDLFLIHLASQKAKNVETAPHKEPESLEKQRSRLVEESGKIRTLVLGGGKFEALDWLKNRILLYYPEKDDALFNFISELDPSLKKVRIAMKKRSRPSSYRGATSKI